MPGEAFTAPGTTECSQKSRCIRKVESYGGGYITVISDGRCFAIGPNGLDSSCAMSSYRDGNGGCPATSSLADGQCHCNTGYSESGNSCQPNSADPGPNRGEPESCGDQAQQGNPVNIGTGNKYQKQALYSGRSPWSLQLILHYNSQVETTGPLGAQWQSNYHRTITSGNAMAYVTREDGKILRYVEQSGVWKGDIANGETLAAITDTAGNPAGWKYHNRFDETEQYDATGKLVSITNRQGKSVQLSYGTSNRLEQIQSPAGKLITFAYDSNNRVNQITNPEGLPVRLAYDGNNNLTRITWPDGKIRQFHYENPSFTHALTGITAENGQRYATYAYDSLSRAVLSEHAGGADRIQIAYGPDNASTVTDALGTARTYKYIAVNGIVKVTSASQWCATCGGTEAANTYDSNGRIITQTDFNGTVTRFNYDTRGLITKQVEAEGKAEGRTTSTEWHPVYRLPMRIAKPYLITNYTRDAKGNVLTRTEQATTDATGASGFAATVSGTPRVWTYTNNADGQIIRVDGPRTDVADVTQYTYDADGNLATITDAIGRVTILSYNVHGQLTGIQSPGGLMTGMVYDNMQRLISTTQDTATSTYGYDANGNLATTTRADGNQLFYQYDAANRLTQITDSLGNRIQYTLDGKGNIIQQGTQDPQGTLTQTHKREYNLLNQLAKDLSALNHATQYAYDANGNLTKTTNPLNLSTLYAVDALNRTTQITDAAGGISKYTYDTADRMTKVTDPRNLVTSYTYNGYGDTLTVTSPDTGLTTHTYDTAGNRISSQDARGKTTGYQYDAANRLRSQTDADGNTAQYTYDITGGLASITEPHTALTTTRDMAGRITGKTQTTGTVSLTQTHTYNSAGQRISHTYPSGIQLQSQYDNMGRVANLSVNINGTLHPLASNIRYAPFGGWTSYHAAHGTPILRNYDTDGRINSLSLDPDTLRSLQYDANHRITRTDDYPIANPQPNNPVSYSYDALDRLTGHTGNGQTRSYQYDANSNRTGKTNNTVTQTYSYPPTSHRLSQADNRSYSYDAAGNTLSDGKSTYTYNALGRMATSTNPSGLTTTYHYNALGQRIKKHNTDTTTHTAYDEQGHIIGEYDATGTATQETVWLYDTPIAVIKQQHIYAIHPDHLDTPRVMTDVNHQTVWAWPNSEAFGDTPANEDPNNSGTLFNYNLRFPGQLYDSETGTHYNYFRDSYAPDVGRYIESDPIGLEGSLNGYLYGNANPLTYTDPLGLTAIPIPMPPPPASCSGSGSGSMGGSSSPVAPGGRDDRDRPDGRPDRWGDESSPPPPPPDCKKALKTCRQDCKYIYINNPNNLPGSGSDIAGRMRRCIRECMRSHGCGNY